MALAAKRDLSSGDITADRRADYAVMLAGSGDHVSASELMEQALELVPGWAAGWFRLGEYRQKAGLVSDVDAFRRALELAPDDIFGASLKLAFMGITGLPEGPPSRYVESLFDDYADRFDASLVSRLGYSVPGKLMKLIAAHGQAPYGHVVDLGCGTGLFGIEIRDACSMLEGFDLSENMLSKARARGIYDRLARADLMRPLPESGLVAYDQVHFADLVVAADVMIYLGDLDAVFANVAAMLKPSGAFAFSVEKSDFAHGFNLLASLRYAHSVEHVTKQLAAHGLTVVAMEESDIRMDAGAPVTGLLFLAVLK